MPFVKKIEVENGILGIWEISETADALKTSFQFSEIEKIEFNRFNHEKRQVEYLATRLLLQILLNIKTEILYSNSGCPKLKNSNLKISISHSAELVTIFISDKPSGIDTENIHRNISKVTNRFLHPEELDWAEKQETSQTAKILLWSAKEAIFKCTKQSGIQFDTQIFIHPFDMKSTDFFNGKLITDTGEENYSLWYFYFGNNIIVYCVEIEN